MRLFWVLSLIPTLSLSAQPRGRPMGDLHLGPILLSFEATSSNAFAVTATERGQNDEVCIVPRLNWQRWSDSTEQVITRQVDPPKGPERIEFTGPRLDAGGCGMRIDRTVTAQGSTYSFSFNHLETPITLLQVETLLGKMKEVSRVTVELSANAAHDTTGARGLTASPESAAAAFEQPYFGFQVEKQAAAMPGNAQPPYPDVLRAANVAGEVDAQFVVDTMGRVDMNTVKVLKSTHDLFTASVKSALPNMKFYPAELAGRKVKQLVQMPFVFGPTR